MSALTNEPTEYRVTARLPGPERRQQLLEAARLAFAGTGYHETSMNDVAKVAGVTKPVLYQRFESKRDLYRAVLEDISQRLQKTVFETAAVATTPREQVEAGFSAYIDFVQEDPDGFKLLFSGASREDSEWAEITDGAERSVASNIAKLLAGNGVPQPHRQTLSYGIAGMAEYMVRHWQHDGEHAISAKDLLNNLTSLAWVGLRGLGPA